MSEPIAMRRLLRVELKRLRGDAGLTQRQVAEDLHWLPSKIIRMESGSAAVAASDLRALLGRYGVRDRTLIDELMRMATQSAPVPFVEYRHFLAVETIRYFGYEASASTIRQFEPLVVPGLAQTVGYTRALLAAHDIPEYLHEGYSASRSERQELLERKDPPELFLILDESALLRVIGGPAVMLDQLHHLLRLSERPHVTIQVLPLTAGEHAGLRGPFALLEFSAADHHPDVLYLENRRSGDQMFVDDADVTSAYREVFWALEDQACQPREFVGFAQRAIDSLA